ncbi:MAG: hypothetical protein AAGF91_07075, partial [Actinomycetota bacterium]
TGIADRLVLTDRLNRVVSRMGVLIRDLTVARDAELDHSADELGDFEFVEALGVARGSAVELYEELADWSATATEEQPELDPDRVQLYVYVVAIVIALTRIAAAGYTTELRPARGWPALRGRGRLRRR